MNLYAAGLAAHGALRWIVLGAGLLLLATTIAAWRAGRPWTRADDRRHALFVAAVDLQMTLGLVLYGLLSPLPASFLADTAAGMKVPTLRFFILDHPVSMLIAVAIIHVARNASKRRMGALRHRHVAITTIVALALILAAIPWPGLRYGRPLLRLSGE